VLGSRYELNSLSKLVVKYQQINLKIFMKKSFFNYENGLLVLLSITFGLVFVDRFALVYLTPFISKDLGLNNTEIGILVSALSLSWAFSGYITTAWAEANNKKKLVFIISVILFSIASISSGFATTFGLLLLSRLLMGFFEGPTLPLIQSFIAKESSGNRLGLNMGILQSLGSTLFGFIIAPLFLVFLAEKYGWRSTFFLAGIPGLIMALLCWKFIKKTTAESNEKNIDESLSLRELLGYKNMRIGFILACLLMTWLNSAMTFMPKFFTEVQGFSNENMGKTMGLMGVASFIAGILVTALSDKFGRKPIISIFIFIGLFYPLAIVFLGGSDLQIPVMFVAYFMFGAFPLVLGAIPFETVPKNSVGKAIGLLAGAGEIVGGVIIPFVCGILADKFGLSAPFYVSFFAAVLALFFSFQLVETKK
jgi:predicted MFS family arabinose efflux permease